VDCLFQLCNTNGLLPPGKQQAVLVGQAKQAQLSYLPDGLSTPFSQPWLDLQT
jgi:hypothetical protein